MTDVLPVWIIRFLRSWLSNRQLRDVWAGLQQISSSWLCCATRIGTGYHTGDIPTTISAHSSTAVYADDASTATLHWLMDKAHQLAQEEIWQLNDRFLSRIIFEPKKTHILAIHRNPAKRREMKEHTIYWDRLQQQPLPLMGRTCQAAWGNFLGKWNLPQTPQWSYQEMFLKN